MTDASEKTDNTPKFSSGDTVTVSRGLNRGRSGKVLDVDTANGQYAVKFADKGDMAVINFGNVKDPVEPTITKTALMTLIDGATTLNDLVTALNETPGWD